MCRTPTLFNFPIHLMSRVKERRILQRVNQLKITYKEHYKQHTLIDTTTTVHNNENVSTDYESETKFVDVGSQTKKNGEELEKTLNDLCRDEKILEQKLCKREKTS